MVLYMIYQSVDCLLCVTNSQHLIHYSSSSHVEPFLFFFFLTKGTEKG